MINAENIGHSLQVNCRALMHSQIIDTTKNWLWAKAFQNVFGLEDARARIGRFDTPWNAKTLFPVPDLEQPLSMDLADILDQRALEIYAQACALNKKIVIMWSGGMDSTAMLAAFIKNLSAQDCARITVCTSLPGIAENAYFYHNHIQGKFELLHYNDLKVSNSFFEQNILLHGDPGDCILGPSVSKYQSLWQDRQYLKPWRSNRSMLYELYRDSEFPEFGTWWVDKVSDNLQDLQNQGKFTNVKTISDWHWWNYFNIKWQGSMTRVFAYNRKDPHELIHKHHQQQYFDLTFYTGHNFQIWSYQNLSRLLEHGMEQHKILLKNYIYELDKNEIYFNHKAKIVSVKFRFYTPLIMDEHAVHYNKSDPGIAELLHEICSS